MRPAIWLLLLVLTAPLAAFDYSLRNEATVTSQGWFDDGGQLYVYGAWKPEVSMNLMTTSDGLSLDTELSGRAWAWRWFNDDGDDGSDAALYRAWLRVTGAYWELRGGLQKLNFGPAHLLRTLQWFDQLDPRDPLQTTEGVWAGLARVYFANNANLWAWGVRGENQQRGVLLMNSKKDSPEWGGRFECPIIDGSLGLTYHHRQLTPMMQNDPTCDSYAIDGRWDWRFGFWTEMAAHRYTQIPGIAWVKSFTFGGDYTIGVGNGVYVVGEAMYACSGDDFFDRQNGQTLLACSANYSLGMLDDVTAIVTYDADSEQFYRYVNWRRAWDYFTLVASIQWNPDSENADTSSPDAGFSVGLMGSVDF